MNRKHLCLISYISTFLFLSPLQTFAQNCAEKVKVQSCEERIKAETKCSGGSQQVVVRYLFGSEKCEWTRQATVEFNKQNFVLQNGKTICVQAAPKGSVSMMEEVAALPDQPAATDEIHLVSPASDISFNLGNARAEKNYGQPIAKKMGLLVKSPVVIAVFEDALQKIESQIGKNRTQIGWADIMDVASSDKSFRFGHTHPDLSNSGVIAVMAQYYAKALDLGVRSRSGFTLTQKHLDNLEVQNFVRAVQNEILYYGKSTGFYADTLLQLAATNSLNAAVLYENNVIEKNIEIRSQCLPLPRLVAVYPSEGTFQSDHPMGLVSKPYVDNEEREAANQYFSFLMSEPQQNLAMSLGFQPGSESIVIDTDLVASVWSQENGVTNFVEDLARGQDQLVKYLAAPSGEVVESALNLWRNKLKKKSHVAAVVDVSGSMGDNNRYIGAQRGAQTLVDYLSENGEENRITLLPFNSDTYVMDFERGYFRDNYVSEAIDSEPIYETYEVDVTIPAVTSMKNVEPSQCREEGGAYTCTCETSGILIWKTTTCQTEVVIRNAGVGKETRQRIVGYKQSEGIADRIRSMNPSIVVSETSRNRLNEVIADQLMPSGGTAMYDAIMASWEYLCDEAQKDTSQEKTIRAIFVLTDGASGDDNYIGTLDELVSRVGFAKEGYKKFDFNAHPECRIPIFGIAYDAEGRPYSDLVEITGSTGGKVLKGASTQDIEKIFSAELAPFL